MDEINDEEICYLVVREWWK